MVDGLLTDYCGLFDGLLRCVFDCTCSIKASVPTKKMLRSHCLHDAVEWRAGLFWVIVIRFRCLCVKAMNVIRMTIRRWIVEWTNCWWWSSRNVKQSATSTFMIQRNRLVNQMLVRVTIFGSFGFSVFCFVVFCKRLETCIFFLGVRGVVERLPKNPPPEVYRYRQHDVWNETEEAYNEYVACNAALSRHLLNGIDVHKIPLRCSGDCNCVVQRGPVGDRGSMCRRIVPCARTELVGRLKFSFCDIHHVRNEFNPDTWILALCVM